MADNGHSVVGRSCWWTNNICVFSRGVAPKNGLPGVDDSEVPQVKNKNISD